MTGGLPDRRNLSVQVLRLDENRPGRAASFSSAAAAAPAAGFLGWWRAPAAARRREQSGDTPVADEPEGPPDGAHILL